MRTQLKSKDVSLSVLFPTLRNQRTPSISRYARSVGAKHHNTSAKLNRGIEEMFLDLTQQMIAKADEKPKSNSRNGGSITIVDDNQTNVKHRSSERNYFFTL